MTRVLVMVGTKKGAYLLESDAARRDWRVRGPFCDGFEVRDVSYDPADGAVYAAATSPWFGPAVFRSPDLGETWTHSSEGLTYGDDGPKLTRVWSVTPGHGGLYAGVEPAGLFRSDDQGASWRHVEGLRRHPSTPDWMLSARAFPACAFPFHRHGRCYALAFSGSKRGRVLAYRPRRWYGLNHRLAPPPAVLRRIWGRSRR
jgi:hypothetical protein